MISEQGSGGKKNMKKLFILLGLGVLSLSGCDQVNPQSPNAKKATFKDMYSLSALSGINMLNMGNTSALKKKATNLTDVEKSEILKKLEIVDNLISGNMITSSEENSDLVDYQKMYSISTSDLDGNTSSYKFYYNESVIVDEDDGDDEVDNEQEFHLSGIVINNDITYKMEGKKEIEDSEFEVEFKIMIDELNYVKVEQEIEDNEEEYKYTSYTNGKKTLEYELEFEVNKNKVEVEFKEKNGTSKKKTKFESVEKNGKKEVKISIEENKIKTNYLILIYEDQDGNIVHEFQ